MALKKVNFKEDEEALFDNAVIYKRGEYWHMRMWLPKEHKYARFSLKTRNKSTAKDKAELLTFQRPNGFRCGSFRVQRRSISIAACLGFLKIYRVINF